ncbi:transporter substrate-binding domain-containing protein [Vibrio campbellii]|uniref:transporter substrate-binding domain-containing protein n=1 Tax=Vibrio campbellii TaxID=680 RepID=UPI0034E39862
MKLFASIAALLITLSFSALAEDFLSKNDRLFLDNQKSLKVGVLAGDWLPYWGNLESKEGINIEYAESMLHDLQIDAEYVPYSSLDTLFNGLENGEIDLTVGFVATQKERSVFCSLSRFFRLYA